MSATSFVLIVFGIILVLLIVFVVLAIFAVELLRRLLRRTPLAPFVGRGGGGNYGTAPDDGD